MNDKVKLSVGAACLVIISGFLVFSTLNPGFASWSRKPIADFFITEGWKQLDASNTVCTIVWEYRGYDTLGEETVLFTAAMGVFALGIGFLSAEKLQDRHEKPEKSLSGEKL